MSFAELGKTLVDARIARGFTIPDAERDTRINRKYLQALEEGKLELMPAPVYARAFLRTYAQYLGINARALVQQTPAARPEPELPPLPEMGRDGGTPLVSASWLVAGAIVVLLIGAGLVLFWSRGGDSAVTTTSVPPAEVGVGQGSDQVIPPAGQAPAPLIIETGIVPDLEDRNVLVAMKALVDAQLPYLVIEIEAEGVPAAIVMEQSPSPGTEAGEGMVVTLTVSR